MLKDGWYVLPSCGGIIVTNELVERLLDTINSDDPAYFGGYVNAAPPSHHVPARFRALALFGRRPPERGVKASLPAPENLHDCCRKA